MKSGTARGCHVGDCKDVNNRLWSQKVSLFFDLDDLGDLFNSQPCYCSKMFEV